MISKMMYLKNVKIMIMEYDIIKRKKFCRFYRFKFKKEIKL